MPDPNQTAATNAQYNREAAITQAQLNRVNQFTPEGSIVYRQAAPTGDIDGMVRADMEARRARGDTTTNEADVRDYYIEQNGGPNRWEAVTTYSPEQQRLYGMSVRGQEIYGRAALRGLEQSEAALSTPFQFNGRDVQYGPDFTGIGNPNQSRQAVQDAMFARMNPQLEGERAALENRLVNQGLSPGTEAWTTAMRDNSQMVNDARYGAILNAGQEQSRMFDLGFQQSGFSNAARTQDLEQQLALRSQPINEANALLTGSMVQAPQFGNVAQVNVAGTDYMGAVGQAQAMQQANYNAQMQRQNAQRTGMYGLGTAALGAASSAGTIAAMGGSTAAIII